MANPNNITLRSEKGSQLTYEELDSNMLELQNVIIEFDSFANNTYPAQQIQINQLQTSFTNLELEVNDRLQDNESILQDTLDSEQRASDYALESKNWANFTGAPVDDHDNYSSKHWAIEAEGSYSATISWAQLAQESKDAAKTSEVNAKTSEDNSLVSEQAAKSSEDNALVSEQNSKISEDNALASEQAAKVSEDAAKISEDNALASEQAAKVSEDNAKISEDNAKDSEDAALISEQNAKASEEAAASIILGQVFDDNTITTTMGWTSQKISDELDLKANSNEIFDDSNIFSNRGWTSQKISDELDLKANSNEIFDDLSTSVTLGWTSQKINNELDLKIDSSDIGLPDGVAPLDSGGKVPVEYLPPILSDTDDLGEGSSNLYFTVQRVRNTTLSGVSFLSNLAITATDSVLEAFGKLQAQINGLVSSKQDNLVSGSNIKTVNGESVLGSGDIEILPGGITISDTAPPFGPDDVGREWFNTLDGTRYTWIFDGTSYQWVELGAINKEDIIPSSDDPNKVFFGDEQWRFVEIDDVADLETQLNEKKIERVVAPSSNFISEVNRSYWLGHQVEVTLPDALGLPIGSYVSFSKSISVEPTIKVFSGPTLIVSELGSATSIEFDLDAEVTFVFNGLNWEI